LIEALSNGIREAGLTISEAMQVKLIDYIELLSKWNAVHNLTGIRDPLEMVTRHLLDSLVLLPFLPEGRMLDVGTGAGLPGIPLAICRPTETIILLDSNQKKITFVQHVILSLKLTNASAVCARVEKYQPEAPFMLVISRAFASLPKFIRQSQHLCAKQGKFIPMKGNVDSAELAAISPGFTVERIVPIRVPGVAASRTLVFISSND